MKPLFFEDSSNESYSLPFETPEELMTHFHELEEQNLSLIQQQQENEQQTEKNRKDFEKLEETVNRTLAGLSNTVEENKQRSKKIIAEKKMLEM